MGNHALFFINSLNNNSMRKRVNRAAICSSENYVGSKKLHRQMLEEKHKSFCFVITNTAAPKHKTIKVFGKDMQVTVDEYNTHCKDYVQNI